MPYSVRRAPLLPVPPPPAETYSDELKALRNANIAKAEAVNASRPYVLIVEDDEEAVEETADWTVAVSNISSFEEAAEVEAELTRSIVAPPAQVVAPPA